ncbi:hypothetical protein ACFQ9X_01850 [Catenulispora yoronensis]
MRPAPAPARRRKSTFRSALASSAVLSGVGAAGVTAFVMFVPSSATGNKTLYTPPDHGGGSAAQLPDYPRPSSGSGAGPALPVTGGVRQGGGPLPGPDEVTAQVVAAVLPPSVTGSRPAGGPTAPTFLASMNSLPSAGVTDTSEPVPVPVTGAGQLNISVAQRSNIPGEVTVTLWNPGSVAVAWSASADASWITLSATSGMLAPGAQTTMRITVDRNAEPSVQWQAHVRFDPSGQSVALSGPGHSGPPSGTPTTSPSTPPTSTPGTPGGPSGSSSGPSAPPSSTPPSSPSSSPSASHSPPPSSGPSTSAGGGPTGPGSSGSPDPPAPQPSGPSGPSSPNSPSGSGSAPGAPSASAPGSTPAGPAGAPPAAHGTQRPAPPRHR